MNNALLLWINQGWAQPWLDPLFIWISQRETFAFPLLIGILFLFVGKFKYDGLKLWLLLLIVIAVGDQLGLVFKHLATQLRPCSELYEIIRQPERLATGPCGHRPDGMPSNHALDFFATAAFTTLILRRRNWGIPIIVIAVLVGISRIYLGKHYPSQVFAGAVIGTLLGCLAAWLGIKYLAFIQRIHAYRRSGQQPE